MKSEPNFVWFQTITPSNIAWDQSKRVAKKPNGGGEKKARPLFYGGQGKKRAYEKSMWNDEGFEYYYTAEKNWMDVYNLRDLFLALINGWERCKPNDRTKKDPIRARWIAPSEDRRKEKEESEVKKAWWESNDDGYSSKVDLVAAYEWDDDVVQGVINKLNLGKTNDNRGEEGK
jgi:hypothetical protein